MTLAALVLAAILAVPFPPPEPHARALADAIADASHAAPLWVTGDAQEEGDIPAGEAATAAVLAGIAYHEVGFLERFARCRCRGAECDFGRALGSWQLNGPLSRDGHDRAAICADDTLQARLAIGVLRRHQARAKTLPAMLRGFASGDPGMHTKAARELAGNVAKVCERMGLVCGQTPRWKGPPS